ncbi:MAG: SOS response-associated peptidase [Suipraeoptans sp.]
MCGRYYVDDETAKEIERMVNKLDKRFEVKIKTDIYPTNSAPIIISNDKKELALSHMNWGFSVTGNSLVINAKTETITLRPMFSDSIKERRCLVPAKGFYEWNMQKEKASFESVSGGTLLLAGVYKLIENKICFVIITTEANDSVINTHERMPLTIPIDSVSKWLLADDEYQTLLKRVPEELTKTQGYEQQSLF